MISATVASPRRCRMSITWRSRRERVLDSDSGLSVMSGTDMRGTTCWERACWPVLKNQLC